MTKEQKEWTVIFLISGFPVERLVLLKRASHKKFAPNFYTGIGGKIGDVVGFENETPLESAYRELDEETKGEVGKHNLVLNPLAKCVIDDDLKLYYFWGIFSKEKLPEGDEDAGILEWVEAKDLLNFDIIPTTKTVCQEWAKRSFAIDQSFTIHIHETGVERGVRLNEVDRVEEGII